jgi:hypothetical protein
MKIVEKFLAAVITTCTIAMLIYAFTSCTPKYGCGNGHKKESWNRMVNRINSFN